MAKDEAATVDLREKDKKNSNKRVISAYRKSSQQETKVYELGPEKKLSYNEALPQKKRLELVAKL